MHFICLLASTHFTMTRPSRYKTVQPTLQKIDEFHQEKIFYSNSDVDWLFGNPIKITKLGDFFTYELEDRSHQNIDLTTSDLDKIFSEHILISNGETFSCLPFSLQTIKPYITKQHIYGNLNSILEGKSKDFDNNYLRFVQPIKNNYSKIGNFTEAIDLNTDQEVMYGVGSLNLEILNLNFDILSISSRNDKGKKDQEFLFIDSCQKMQLEGFQKITESFFKAYAYIFGIRCGGSSYIAASSSPEFKKIDKILFNRKPEEQIHKNYLFDSMEIRKYNFSESYFLFPKGVLTNMCNSILTEEKYERTLNILHEANMNKYSLSTSILYTSALETISSIIPVNETVTDAIDSRRFSRSQIKNDIVQVISNNKILTDKDKEFLVTKKLNSINGPTNANKLEAPFLHYGIRLPEKFKKAIKYRNYYLHGSAPKEAKLGSFRYDDYNRAFELQFLVNILTLKFVGYKGFLKNRSLEMEYYVQKNQGKSEDDIIIDQSLYYKI